MGSERNLKAAQRQLLLAASSEATEKTKMSEAAATCNDSFVDMGLHGGEGNIEAGQEKMRKTIQLCIDAGKLSENPVRQNFLINLFRCHAMGLYVVASHMTLWSEPNEIGGSEAELTQGIDYYNYHVCGKLLKAEWGKIDIFRQGPLTSTLGLLCTFHFRCGDPSHPPPN